MTASLLAGVPVLEAQQTTAITGVGVVDVQNGVVLPDRTVVIEDGRISAIELNGIAPAGSRIVDGGGVPRLRLSSPMNGSSPLAVSRAF